MNFEVEVIFSACLSYGRIILKKGKGPFQTILLLINEAIFRNKNKNQILLNTESRKSRFNYNTENSTFRDSKVFFHS